jgi:ABC-type lipopolysaccharide export system ATPase subunit
VSRGVALHGLRKSFRTQAGTVEAVRGIDVSVARGETVAVLGPNGAGLSEPLYYMVGIVAFATPAGDDGHDPVGLVPFPMTSGVMFDVARFRRRGRPC